MSDAHFYLGRFLDDPQGNTGEPLHYDPPDLTTHAIVTGMTGSGKTGLCVTLLEEAALQGVPALVIDPKGDLTNLLLHFPDLAPQDFQPWVDSETARRSGETVEQAAAQTAETWKKGLAEWGVSQERLRALKNAAQFAVYTPGSDAGLPVSVLSSLAAPALAWDDNREVLREKISSTVTALLGLVGLEDVDPLRSREHILISNIFENAWSEGRDLDLTELILQTQNPPFEKLGALPVETFFPGKDRLALVMRLNAILASPSFETWREGQPLDIPGLLYTPDGRPRHSVFYLAHLSDVERMFFVTLLFSAVETWMRTQAGATSLRAILYMDEIFGYLPPAANPPSKPPLLRMLKQARAFGVGLLLATQNPVDVDYKALSNAGTWFIGKLQTEQDKDRLLDGLESAGGGLDRRTFDKLISGLGKRVFILHNVHAKQPVLFQTRWAMNYLAGPLTRTQIPALNKLVGADALTVSAPGTATRPKGTDASLSDYQPVPAPRRSDANRPGRLDMEGSQTRPPVPAGVGEYFLPLNLSLTEAFDAAGKPLAADAQQVGVLYRPALLASAQVRFLNRKYGVDSEMTRTVLIETPDPRGVARWEDFIVRGLSPDAVASTPAPQARFAPLDAPLNKSRPVKSLKRDFADWLYRTVAIKARANKALKVYAGPDVSQADFMRACADAAREERDAEVEKAAASYGRKITTLKNRLKREQRELKQDEEELSDRKMEEIGTHAENVLSIFSGSRRSRRLSTSLTKRRLTQQAKSDVEESLDAIEDYEQQIADLEQERDAAIEEINDRWGDVVNDTSEITVTPKKADIFVSLFGVSWMPYYLVQSGEETMEAAAFGKE